MITTSYWSHKWLFL